MLGGDGAGKSTLARNLQATLAGPVRIYKLRLFSASQLSGRAIRRLAQGSRALRLALASRADVMRGALVIWDRHPLEDALTRTVGRRTLRHGLAWTRHLVPRPDVILVLDAPGELLHERRAGAHAAADLEMLRAIYLEYARGAANAVVLDASKPAGELLSDAIDELERFLPVDRR